MKGSVIGAALIIAGTAIGAGMLAIPLVAGSLGFVSVSILFFICWGTTQIAAFLLLHVNMAYQERTNLGTMSRHLLGKTGNSITWVVYLLLLYSVLAAYMTGGATLLGHTLSQFFEIDLPSIVNALLFTVIFGSIIYVGTRSVDYVNRTLLTLKLGAFFFMVTLLLPHIRLEALAPRATEPIHFVFAMPVLITSFAYQMVIPNLRDYFHSNVKKIKKALWIGGTIPLVVYFLWVSVVFGLLPALTPQDDLATMVTLLEKRVKIHFLSLIVNFFTDVAVTTSFLGVSMSLFHFIQDGCNLNHKGFKDKAIASLITFVPPLCFAWVYPKGFLMALSFAGIFVVGLFILIPLWMGLKMIKRKKESLFSFKLHWTGFALLLLVSLSVIFSQIWVRI